MLKLYELGIFSNVMKTEQYISAVISLFLQTEIAILIFKPDSCFSQTISNNMLRTGEKTETI